MRTPARTVVPTLALLAFIPTALDAQIHDRGGLVAALDSAARAHVEHAMVAGVSVAVVRGGDTLLERGYGYADLEWGIETPQDASASYEIGSITKQFTAAAIMQLVEEGKLDLDADFTDYLTDFDAQGHVVPLRRLLDHTSGIKGYTEMPGFGDLSKQDLPRDTLVSLVEAEPFEFEPGTAQIYNNSAFFFLGLIIERVSGESYEEYVQKHLFDELGMDDSYYCSESAIRENRAHGYDGSPEGLQRKAYLDHAWPYAGGSLCSTAGDLILWNQVGWTPTSLAMRRQLQCVASAGFSSRVFADDLRFVVRSDLAGSTRAWSVLEQLFNATCLVPVEPLRDRRPRYAHLPADRRPRLSLGRAENDVGPFDHALRCGPFVHQSLQAPAFSSAQPNPTHWKSHARNLSHVEAV